MINRTDKGFTLIEISIVISIIAIISFIAVPRFMDLKNDAQETSSKQLLSSLKTSATFYVAQEGKLPLSFSDFVIVNGQATGVKTLSLDNISSQVSSIKLDTPQKTLEVTFTEGGSATYYLNGVDVTADYNF